MTFKYFLFHGENEACIKWPVTLRPSKGERMAFAHMLRMPQHDSRAHLS